MLANYFSALYRDAMERAHEAAYAAITAAIDPDSRVLDCGASGGASFDQLARRASLSASRYSGIDWHPEATAQARARGLDVLTGDLNQGLARADGEFSCVFALSLLEHLLNPCRFLRDCHRVLRPGGTLVLLTPNISTYFTAALILAGRMPSTGPHPDSNALLAREEVLRVNQAASAGRDGEGEHPMHRHLVVFSYRVLRDYLQMLGFHGVQGRGFGLYPFPRVTQALLERIDPWHCHQMVFVARR